MDFLICPLHMRQSSTTALENICTRMMVEKRAWGREVTGNDPKPSLGMVVDG